MGKYAVSARLRPRDLLVPPGPEPYRGQWRDRINQSRVLEIARQIAPSYPAEAVALRAAASMRYAHVAPLPQRGNRSGMWMALGAAAAAVAVVLAINRRSS